MRDLRYVELHFSRIDQQFVLVLLEELIDLIFLFEFNIKFQKVSLHKADRILKEHAFLLLNAALHRGELTVYEGQLTLIDWLSSGLFELIGEFLVEELQEREEDMFGLGELVSLELGSVRVHVGQGVLNYKSG